MSRNDAKSIVCYFDGQFLFILTLHTHYDFGDSNEQASYKCQLFEHFIGFLTVIWWISDAFQHILWNEGKKRKRRSSRNKWKLRKFHSENMSPVDNYERHFNGHFLKIFIKLTATYFALSHADSIIHWVNDRIVKNKHSNNSYWTVCTDVLSVLQLISAQTCWLSKHLYKYCSFRWKIKEFYSTRLCK